jgi:hypothetical protein
MLMMGDISEATSIYILVYFNIKILLFIYINKLLHPNGYLEKGIRPDSREDIPSH